MEWTVKLSQGPCRVNHAAVAVDDCIYSFGGYVSNGNFKDTTLPIEIFHFNASTFKWRTITYDKDKAPYKRYGHSAVAYGHLVYLWGGRNDIRCDSKLYCFDTVTETWSKPEVKGSAPLASDGHAACLHNDIMYIHGGYVERLQEFTLSLYALNLKTFIWTELARKGDHPLYRDFHTMTTLPNGHLVVFGGREMTHSHYQGPTNELYHNSLHFYNTVEMMWYKPPVPASNAPLGRRSHSAFVYQGSFFIFGGFNSLLQCHLNDVHSYDKENNLWVNHKFTSACPNPRRRQALCVVRNFVYMFGGTCPRLDTVKGVVPITELRDDSDNEELQELDDLWLLNMKPSLLSLCLLRCVGLGLPLKEMPLLLQNMAAMVPRSDSPTRALTSPTERG